jgi:hypothetical protein
VVARKTPAGVSPPGFEYSAAAQGSFVVGVYDAEEAFDLPLSGQIGGRKYQSFPGLLAELAYPVVLFGCCRPWCGVVAVHEGSVLVGGISELL